MVAAPTLEALPVAIMEVTPEVAQAEMTVAKVAKAEIWSSVEKNERMKRGKESRTCVLTLLFLMR